MMSSVEFKSILSQIVSGDLSSPENSVWLVYAAVIVETISPASQITELWKYIARQVKDEDKQLTIARRLREGLLKTSPLAGFPRVSNTYSELGTNVLSPNQFKGHKLPSSPTISGERDITVCWQET